MVIHQNLIAVPEFANHASCQQFTILDRKWEEIEAVGFIQGSRLGGRDSTWCIVCKALRHLDSAGHNPVEIHHSKMTSRTIRGRERIS
jgi:hypothetical protein